MYDLQKWLNKFHTAMAAELAAYDSISETTVSHWESEFEAVKRTIVPHESGESSFFVALSIFPVILNLGA